MKILTPGFMVLDEKIMSEYKILLDQAQRHFKVPSCPTVSDAIALLQGFGATSFDFETNQESLADEFVDRRYVVGAYTIHDPRLLKERATAEELQVAELSLEESEEDTDIEYPDESAEWNQIQDELSSLQRLVIVIEHGAEDPNMVGNFRVHGFGQWLRESLWASTGVLPRDPGVPSTESVLFGRAFELSGREVFQAAAIPQRRPRRLAWFRGKGRAT
ncbi:hypothetical protein ACIPUB_10180 [Paeniglutamicibacter sp. ORCA_105]|uniref:hypothetical protein n=1 Tax=Paeniglutamicibacter sp. ORCA_105 TaxID=3377336 RepID=UPI0038958EF9